MLITLDPDSHRLNSILRRPLLCTAVVLHDEGQAFGGLIGIHCMRNLSIGAVLIAICRGNESYCTLVHIILELGGRRGKAAVDQTIVLAGLLTGGNVCAEYRNNFIIQTTDIVGRGVHRRLLQLPDRVELPLLGLAGELGDGLAALFEVFLALIPAIERIAVPCGNGKFIASLQLILRNSICLAKVCDLRAGLVVDGVVDGVVPVGFDSQVAGRASRNLGDCFLAAAVQIAAPLQEGLAEHAVLRDRVQRDSLLDRVLLSVFGIKLLIRNVLVAVVVRDRVLDGRVVAVELPLLNLRRRSELFRSCFADVLLVLIPAVELIAVRNSGHPQRVGRSLRDRNVFLMQDLPTVAVLYRVSYREGALLPDGIEGDHVLARADSQLFTGPEVFYLIVRPVLILIQLRIPAEELVARAGRERFAVDREGIEAIGLHRDVFGHILDLTVVCARVCVIEQRLGLALDIDRGAVLCLLLPLAGRFVIREGSCQLAVLLRGAQIMAHAQIGICKIARRVEVQRIAVVLAVPCGPERSSAVRNRDSVRLVVFALDAKIQAVQRNVLLGGCRNPVRVNFGRRMREIYRHRIARFPSLLVRIPRIGNACGVVPQCVVR